MLSEQGKQYLASVIPSVLATLFGYFSVVPQDFGRTLKFGVAILLVIVVIILEYILIYTPALDKKERQLSTYFPDYLRLIENEVESMASRDVSVRANIMRPTGGGIRKDPTFSIAYYNNPDTYKKGEMELDFDLNQGVVGSTYQTGTESIAISKNQISGWEDGWNTSETQDKVTNHLNTIVGTPIYKPSQNEEDSKPAAVLIIDSEDSLDSFIDNTTGQSLDEAFKDSELSDELWTHATNIGIIL